MPEVALPPPITFATLIAPGVAAVKKFWRPFLLLQFAALLLVVSYYQSSRVRSLCEHISYLKEHSGLLFITISAAFAGAFLPEVAKAVMLGDWRITRKRLRDFRFAVVVFAANGVITDFQYRVTTLLLGSDHRLITVIEKVLLDQLLFTPFYGTMYWILVYSLRANRYNVLNTLRPISPRWYMTRAAPLLIPAWCFWCPMVVLIYSLPTPLQFSLYCFALAAWSLLMVFVATHEAEAGGGAKIEDRG